jgi:hypothetical protein
MSTMTLHPNSFRPTAPQMRLTRRGRLVLFGAALVVVLASVLLIGSSSMASNEPGVTQETEVVMVGYGETLWEISADLATDGRVREMMTTIKELNALDSSMLVAGQELHIPVTD